LFFQVFLVIQIYKGFFGMGHPNITKIKGNIE
jgi:hypothetical protein